MFVLAASCGRAHFDPVGGDGGGHGDGSALRDAPVDACPFGAWSAPMSIPELSGASDDSGPQLAADGVTLYFASARVGLGDLFVAVRPDQASPFGPVIALSVLDSTSLEDDPTVTDDQLDILFTSDRTTPECIYEATRSSVTQPFSAPIMRAELCNGVQAAGPSISGDGLTLYYTQHDNLSALGTILFATRSSRGAPFDTPTFVLGGGGMLAGYPSLSRDGLTIYYEAATPTLDLYSATRASYADPFGGGIALPFNQSNQADQDAAITADERELFFSSQRPGGAGGDDLYVVTRACL